MIVILNIKFNNLSKVMMKKINEYKNRNKHVCMIGDEINDALALKLAFAGVERGCLGIESLRKVVDTILVSDDIQYINYLIRI